MLVEVTNLTIGAEASWVSFCRLARLVLIVSPVTSFAGCEGSTSINVSEVYDLPEPDLGPNVNAPTSPVILDPGIYVAYVWNTGSLDSVISVSIAGTYSVTVTDNHSCQGTDEVKVKFWTTGVDELNNGSFSLFPNPSSTEVRIIGDQSGIGLHHKKCAKVNSYDLPTLGQSAVNENHRCFRLCKWYLFY